jgi:hypothetical protein
MAQTIARLRIFASATDYLTIDGYYQALPEDAPGFQIVEDQYGLDVILAFPSDAGKAWTKRLGLMISTRKRLLKNNSAAATQRNIRAWFDHYVRDTNTQLVVFVQGHGWDSSGTEVTVKDYYRGRIIERDPWLKSNLNSAGGIPPYLRFVLSVDAEGTFSDFDTMTSITARTTRP